ncbi:glycosyltransferase family 4 protein, partial [bacterium]|nr:glycosyltransferase family 4 protein [bacterium]
AFACGLPVIASEIGGLPFVVADESRGLLFPPGDIAGLITQIKRLLDDHQLRDQMGRNGRTYFETEFLWDDIIKKKYVPVLGSPIVSESADQ